MKRKILVHRYDNEPDILAIEKRGYSDVYKRTKDDDFELVVVVPTNAAKTSVAVVAEATSGQYRPLFQDEAWPGRPDHYLIRVDVRNVRYTTRERVRQAFQIAGETWAAQWTVKLVELDERLLFEDEDLTMREWLEKEPPPDVSGVRLAEELESEDGLYEGAAKQILVNAYERNRKARQRCIQYHGTACVICGFDFGEVYGAEAHGYIQVHHLQPLATLGKEYEVDPILDLRPVCPNCHAVIHLGVRVRSIEEVRRMLSQNVLKE